MKDSKYYCDGCKADITYGANSVSYRLLLRSERQPSDPQYPVTDMMIYPDIEQDAHFCGLECLKNWLSNK